MQLNRQVSLIEQVVDLLKNGIGLAMFCAVLLLAIEAIDRPRAAADCALTATPTVAQGKALPADPAID